MPKLAGKSYPYTDEGRLDARNAAQKIMTDKNASAADKKAADKILKEYAKDMAGKKPGTSRDNTPAPKDRKPKKKNPSTVATPRQRPQFMYGGMANKKKHSYSNGGSVIDNLTPAQKKMVKKMAEANN